MIRDVIRFGRESPEVLRPESEAEVRQWCMVGGCFPKHACRLVTAPCE